MEAHIAQYESVLAAYRTQVMDKMSVYDYMEFQEALLNREFYGSADSVDITFHKAFCFLVENVGEKLSMSLLCDLHRCLSGETIFGDHEELVARVPQLLEATQKAIDKGETHPVCIAARFHCFFEHLHPFRDGNGRTGRLMANFILLSMGHPMVIIPSEQKSEYILALQMYKKEHTVEYIEHFFLSTAIARMEHEMAEKRELTAQSKLRFII